MNKVYFGRIPEGKYTNIDKYFPEHLRNHNYNFASAVDALLEDINSNKFENDVYYTLNPLIPNFMDDKVALELFWIIDENGNEIHLSEDASCTNKIMFMSPGELLCDDARSFI